MIKVYVAGPYSADNVLDVLRNIGRGEKICAELFALGYAPFCPWHDKSYVTDNPDGKFTINQFYEFSIAWLEVSDAVLVIGKYPLKSKGTLAEIDHAMQCNIPIFYNIKTLIDYFINNKTRKG